MVENCTSTCESDWFDNTSDTAVIYQFYTLLPIKLKNRLLCDKAFCNSFDYADEVPNDLLGDNKKQRGKSEFNHEVVSIEFWWKL